MAKRSKNTNNLGFSYWSTNDYLRECPNIVRWNARLAIDWMNGIAPLCISDTQIHMYNYAATQMNRYLDSLEKMRYYDKFETWDNDRVRRVELLSIYDETTA